MRIVMIEWKDIVSGDHWNTRGEEEHSERIVSVGILVREDDTAKKWN